MREDSTVSGSLGDTALRNCVHSEKVAGKNIHVEGYCQPLGTGGCFKLIMHLV